MRKFIYVFVALLGLGSSLQAQEAQGKYLTSASARMSRLIDVSNKKGWILHNNAFSIGGAWLKQSRENWVSLYSVRLTAGKDHRFLAVGDMDARDVDLRIVDSSGNVVVADASADPEAIVDYNPRTTGTYTVQVRLYASRDNLPSVCFAIMMVR